MTTSNGSTPVDHGSGDARTWAPIERPIVIVPTFNERENVENVVTRILSFAPQVHVLVADDNSPDGTGVIADRLAEADDRVHVLHRLGKEGLGAAYLAGFAWALEHGYDAVVEMDADGSHRAEDLPRLLEALEAADLVLGSRWVEGGAVANWPKSREILSKGGNLYARLALQVPLHDATGGFRAFRASTLRALDLHNVASQGYCFQVDLAYRAVQAGLTVVEIPILFVEREFGTSKMDRRIVSEALWLVTVWGVDARVEKFRKWREHRRTRKTSGWQ